nr:MAG TPA: hypothetical protein [Caudoviricetes sp.]
MRNGTGCKLWHLNLEREKRLWGILPDMLVDIARGMGIILTRMLLMSG